jgi:hypothetical protein
MSKLQGNELTLLFLNADAAESLLAEAVVTLQTLISAAEAGNGIDAHDLESIAKPLQGAAFFSRAVREDVRDALQAEDPESPDLAARRRLVGDYPSDARAEGRQ